MKKRLISLIAFTIFLNSKIAYGYSDKYSPDEIFAEYSNEDTKFSVLVYFNGLGAGLSWANTAAEHEGNNKLFCLPRNTSFGAEDYFRIYRLSYFRNKDVWDSMTYQPPGFILLEGLKSEYPC